jgi:hypothetical protein
LVDVGLGFGFGFGTGLGATWCTVVRRGATTAALVTRTLVVVLTGAVVVGTGATVVVTGAAVVATGATTAGTVVVARAGAVLVLVSVSEVGVLVGCWVLPRIPANTNIASTTAPVIHGQRRLRFGFGGFGG